VTAIAPPTYRLPCFGCSHKVAVVSEPMRLAMAFRPSLVPAVAMLAGEFRRRCRSCGWVNVFVPVVDVPVMAESWRAIELKREA
jgi:hypothetical protein